MPDGLSSARETVFAPLHVEGAVERIVRRLGEAIGSGLLRPGERLPSEHDLADRLEVAPMTLRQALAVLRDAGFVETRRGRGAGSFVANDAFDRLARAGQPPSLTQLRGLIDWRRAISAEAAALAAERSSAADREAIVQAARAVEGATSLPFSSYRLADSAFHLVIAEAARSPRLVAGETSIQAELAELLAGLPGSESSDALAASTAGHEPMIAAILGGDGRAARIATVCHVEATYDWIVGLRLGRLRELP